MTVSGAKPMGVQDELHAAETVQQMFNSIAPRYDLLNHVLSANIDRLWWRRTAARFREVLANPDAAVLDICCGTGDLTMALLRRRPWPARPVLAADFAHGMLSRGAQKFGVAKPERSIAVALEADALHLPLRSQSLDLIVTAFGFRNLANYEAGLREFHRVLKPGGQLGILEFSEPGGLIGKVYALYFHRVLPAIGRMIWAAVPVVHSIGTNPMIATPSVSSLGRRRCTAPSSTACRSTASDGTSASPPCRASACRR